MAHIPQGELNQKLQQAARDVVVGATYGHYKYPDRTYQVLHLAIQEATEQVCVIYQDASHPDAPIFVRDLDSWLEIVPWQGRLVPRFVLQSK
jgi:hypothetical protein